MIEANRRSSVGREGYLAIAESSFEKRVFTEEFNENQNKNAQEFDKRHEKP